MKQIVTVKSKMKPFIPQILNNTQNDISALQKSIQDQNFEEMYRMAHSMKGYAKPFGFDKLEDLAISIQGAAKDERLDDAKELVDELNHYFFNIEIVYN